jgi:5-dehydro-4-deoxyglucarate dehydratase
VSTATRTAPADLAAALKQGLLSFPVTPFTADLALDLDAYRAHVDWQAGYGVAGLFAAGGTGEGFSLTVAETAQVVAAAVDVTAGRVPVLGVASGNTAQAVTTARSAAEVGASGVLLLPPYLTECDQQGLAAHVAAVCAATPDLGVIVYNRANARYRADTLAALAEQHANLIGFKDGIGDLEHLARVVTVNGDRLFYLGGLPTAETFALPLLQMGMSTYSSAIYNFLPDFALQFYADVRAGDRAAVTDKLREFVLPYLDIRDRVKGYGVSIVKAGLITVGRGVGGVRPPLQDLSERDLDDLTALVRSLPAQYRPN